MATFGNAILMYHSVHDGPAAAPFARYVVTPRRLAEHLDVLVGNGYTPVGLHELRTAPESERLVGLTFDDGYRDFYDHALPILQKYAARASLFVPSGYLNGTARWLASDGEGERPIIDWAQLRAIADAGCVEIGAHTHSHTSLDSEDAVRVRVEVTLPRLILEQGLQRPITTIAYPFGYYNRTAIRLARSAGYEFGCGVGERTSARTDPPLALPRWSVYPTMTATDVLGLVRRPATAVARATSEGKRHLWRLRRRFGESPHVALAPLPPLDRTELNASEQGET